MSLAGPEEKKLFMGWRKSWASLIKGLLAELFILGASAICVFTVHSKWGLNFFSALFVFYLFTIAWALVVLRMIRVFFSFREGTYSYEEFPEVWQNWNLYAFLYYVHSSILLAILPIPFRVQFYKLLGAEMGKGSVSISGHLLEPHLVTFKGNCNIGYEALLLPHAGFTTSSDVLILGRITLGNNVVIGVRSLVMPGVTVGENSMVLPMSFLERNTQIPANEVWGGNPARKIKDMPQGR